MVYFSGLVDLYSSLSPEIEKSSEEKVEAKTPARSKKLAQFFRTPAAGIIIFHREFLLLPIGFGFSHCLFYRAFAPKSGRS